MALYCKVSILFPNISNDTGHSAVSYKSDMPMKRVEWNRELLAGCCCQGLFLHGVVVVQCFS